MFFYVSDLFLQPEEIPKSGWWGVGDRKKGFSDHPTRRGAARRPYLMNRDTYLFITCACGRHRTPRYVVSLIPTVITQSRHEPF